MSEVKRLNLDLEYPFQYREDAEGNLCYYADYATLKAERDALAAEMSVMDAIHDKCVFITDDDYDACPKSVQEIIRSLAVMKIPATTTYLNSVRADAVVNAAAHLGDMAAGKSASTAELIKSCGRALLAFSAKIRAGEPS